MMSERHYWFELTFSVAIYGQQLWESFISTNYRSAAVCSAEQTINLDYIRRVIQPTRLGRGYNN